MMNTGFTNIVSNHNILRYYRQIATEPTHIVLAIIDFVLVALLVYISTI